MTNAEWLASPIAGPPGTTVQGALQAIKAEPTCPQGVRDKCDFWLSWTPGPPPNPPTAKDFVQAQAGVQAAWLQIQLPPIPWPQIEDELDHPPM